MTITSHTPAVRVPGRVPRGFYIKRSEEMALIYCCGNRGAVGFVSGWDFAETDSSNVVDVRLTLDIESAYRFDGRDENRRQLGAVLGYLRRNKDVYGTVEVLGEGA